MSLRKKCPYLELFWSVSFPHFPAFGLNTESSVFRPTAGKCGKNADQNNSEYGHFLRSAYWLYTKLEIKAVNVSSKVQALTSIVLLLIYRRMVYKRIIKQGCRALCKACKQSFSMLLKGLSMYLHNSSSSCPT